MTDPRLKSLGLFAWVGEDEYGSGEIGLKQGITGAGTVPLVAVQREKIDRPDLREGLSRQSRAFTKPIYLARFAFAEILGLVDEPSAAKDIARMPLPRDYDAIVLEVVGGTGFADNEHFTVGMAKHGAEMPNLPGMEIRVVHRLKSLDRAIAICKLLNQDYFA